MDRIDTTRPDQREQDYARTFFRSTRRKFGSARTCRANALPTRDIRRQGIALIWVAIFLLVLILLAGLSLDTAKVVFVAHQLHNAADAAALAGAQIVKVDQSLARQQSIAIAGLNYADRLPVFLRDNQINDPNLDVVIGRYYRQTGVFAPTTDAPNAVKVVARRTAELPDGPVPLNFGPIADVDNANVARYAIAISSGTTGAGLICLAPEGTGLEITGNVTIDVNNGDVQVNSETALAVDVHGTSCELLADEMNVCGEADPQFDWTTVPFPVNQGPGVEPIPDPLCPPDGLCLPPPTWDATNDLSGGETVTIPEGTYEFEPGYYSGGFDISGGTITLKPGIYVLGGGPKGKGGLVVSGNANFCAKGVMFYITDNGQVDLTGTGDLRITPPEKPQEDGPAPDFCDPNYAYPAGMDWTYEGLSIFQDRQNTNEARIIGTSNLDLNGTLYFPSNHVELGGTGFQAGNQLIAWTVEVHGTGEININYDGRNPAVGYMSYLVE